MDTINRLYDEWLSLQPLKQEDTLRLNRKFMLEFNYNSNHIEGNTLTYGQTETLLLFGKVVNDADMRDLEEMKAHSIALKMMQEEADEKVHPLTENFVRQLHKIMLCEDYTQYRRLADGTTTSFVIHAGQYKTRPNSVVTQTGETFSYASPEETKPLMADLVDWYNNAEEGGSFSPIEMASLFHYRFIRIHPFEDGNGRIARLLVNYILRRHNYPMIVVESKDKTNYLSALNRCDVAVGMIPSVGAHAELTMITPLTDYLNKCLEHALRICIKAAKGESIEEDDDFDKRLSVLQRNARIDFEKVGAEDTPQNKIDVFNNFHCAFAKDVLRSLAHVDVFFNTFTVYYFMSKNLDSINGNGFFDLQGRGSLSLDESDEENDIIKDARSIMFHVAFQGVKRMYNLKDVSIFLKASVLFDLSYYTFNGKMYRYGSYPSEEEKRTVIKAMRSEVMEKLNEKEA